MLVPVSTTENPFEEIAYTLWTKIRKGQSASHDILFDLVNTAVWQSPKELALKWIEKMAADEWKTLTDSPSESIETRKSKEAIRKRLLTLAGQFLYVTAKQPTFLQKYSTRLLVKEVLTQKLSHNDQDRIIAAELMTKYKHWKSLASLLSQNDILNDERVLVEMPSFSLNKEGEESCMLSIDGHVGHME
jgi:hypothetical protein